MASKWVNKIIVNILEHSSFLNNDEELPPWSTKIWKSVADSTNSSAKYGQKSTSSQYLYTLVKENGYNIRTELGFDKEPISEQISNDNVIHFSSTDGETELFEYKISVDRKN